MVAFEAFALLSRVPMLVFVIFVNLHREARQTTAATLATLLKVDGSRLTRPAGISTKLSWLGAYDGAHCEAVLSYRRVHHQRRAPEPWLSHPTAIWIGNGACRWLDFW